MSATDAPRTSALSNEGRVRVVAAETDRLYQAFIEGQSLEDAYQDQKDEDLEHGIGRELTCRCFKALLADFSNVPDCTSLIKVTIPAGDDVSFVASPTQTFARGQYRSLLSARWFTSHLSASIRFVILLTKSEIKSMCRGLLHVAFFQLWAFLRNPAQLQNLGQVVLTSTAILNALVVQEPQACQEVFLAQTISVSNQANERRPLLEMIYVFFLTYRLGPLTSQDCGSLSNLLGDAMVLSNLPVLARYFSADQLISRKEVAQRRQEQLVKRRWALFCSYCGKIPQNDLLLKRCGGCRLTFYCDTTCSAKDWSKGNPEWGRTTPHKKVCHRRALKIKSSSSAA